MTSKKNKTPAHTAEPWRTDSVGLDRLWILDSQSNYIAEIVTEDECGFVVNSSEQIANGRRIVACVNGCQGINPKAVPDLLRTVRSCSVAFGERLSCLSDELNSDLCDPDDIRAQIDNYKYLQRKCKEVIAASSMTQRRRPSNPNRGD